MSKVEGLIPIDDKFLCDKRDHLLSGCNLLMIFKNLETNVYVQQ